MPKRLCAQPLAEPGGSASGPVVQHQKVDRGRQETTRSTGTNADHKGRALKRLIEKDRTLIRAIIGGRETNQADNANANSWVHAPRILQDLEDQTLIG